MSTGGRGAGRHPARLMADPPGSDGWVAFCPGESMRGLRGSGAEGVFQTFPVSSTSRWACGAIMHPGGRSRLFVAMFW